MALERIVRNTESAVSPRRLQTYSECLADSLLSAATHTLGYGLSCDDARHLRQGIVSQYKPFLIDTFASMSFSAVVGSAIELGISGMSLEDTMQSRLVMQGYSICTGRLFGKVRDWMYKQDEITPTSTSYERWLTDTKTAIMFYMPFYAANLYRQGTTGSDLLRACAVMTVSCAFTARPSGIYQDWLRSLGGLPPADQANQNSSQSTDLEE